jgi:hypothetical protein
MVNQRGWLRIVEASIAILIIFGVLLIITRNSAPQPSSTDLASMTIPILTEMANNLTLRDYIVRQGNTSIPELTTFVGARIKQSSVKYEVNVCDVDSLCALPQYPAGIANVYAGERIVSSTLNEFNPKKVKIFLWRTT